MTLIIKRKVLNIVKNFKESALNILKNEKGEMVATIGWMAIVATILVLAHGLVTGWLPGFIERIFDSMDTLV